MIHHTDALFRENEEAENARHARHPVLLTFQLPCLPDIQSHKRLQPYQRLPRERRRSLRQALLPDQNRAQHIRAHVLQTPASPRRDMPDRAPRARHKSVHEGD